MSDVPPPYERPRPVQVAPAEGGGAFVTPGWLDQAPVTRALIALNVAVFAVQLVISGGQSLMRLPHQQAMAFGASYPLATIGENRWETLVTACFLHDGLLHIAFNMLALWQAGPLLERAVGSARFTSMYLVAGVAGNAVGVAEAWLSGVERLTVGASGAIAGAVAAAMVAAWRAEGWGSPMAWAMARWLGLVVASGLFANLAGMHIANSAHVGGAVAGALVAASWRRGKPPSPAFTAATLAACTGILAACIGVVGWRDRTDRFATMSLGDRSDFTASALEEGRCVDAFEGERAVDRLRSRPGRATSLRARVEGECPVSPPPVLPGIKGM